MAKVLESLLKDVTKAIVPTNNTSQDVVDLTIDDDEDGDVRITASKKRRRAPRPSGNSRGSEYEPIDLTGDGPIAPSRRSSSKATSVNNQGHSNGKAVRRDISRDKSNPRSQPSPESTRGCIVDESPQPELVPAASNSSHPTPKRSTLVEPMEDRQRRESRIIGRHSSKSLVDSVPTPKKQMSRGHSKSSDGHIQRDSSAGVPRPSSDKLSSPVRKAVRESASSSLRVTGSAAPSTPLSDTQGADRLSYQFVADAWENWKKELCYDHERNLESELKRARTALSRDCNVSNEASIATAVPNYLIDKLDFFADLNPIEVNITEIPTTSIRNSSKTHSLDEDSADFTQLLILDSGQAKTKQIFQIKETPYNSDAIIMPSYLSHTTLTESIIAENDRKFLAIPRMAGTDEGNEELLTKIRSPNYFAEHGWTPLTDNRFDSIDQKHRAWKYNFYVEKFLQDIGINYEAVIYYLLEDKFEDRAIMRKAMKLIEKADAQRFKNPDHFDMKRIRADITWKDFRSRLTEPASRQLAAAGLACCAFSQQEQFNLWEIACYSIIAQRILQDIADEHRSNLDTQQAHSKPLAYRNIACKICHLHACPFHGQMLEVLGDTIVELVDEEPTPRSKKTTKDGSDPSGLSEFEASNNNMRKLVVAPQHQSDDFRSNADNGYFATNYWIHQSGAWRVKERSTFYPCDHTGPCDEAKCSCFKARIPCEKICGCSKECERRFPGCSCSQHGHKTCIEKESSCLCKILQRECDPDLCGTCGVIDVLDPVNKKTHDQAWLDERCKNCYIQRGVAKKTWLAESEIPGAGFGLFTGVNIRSNDFIGEYKGENISATELKRREIVDDRTYYLFDLCADTTTDAGTKGNKIRFVNNSSNHANCFAQNMVCNMHVRIGLYALRDIKAREELYFNYNWPEHVRQHLEFGERDGRREKAPRSPTSKKGKRAKDKNKKPFGKPIIQGASKHSVEGSDSSSSFGTEYTGDFELTRENLSRLNSEASDDQDDLMDGEMKDEEVRGENNRSDPSDDDYEEFESDEEMEDVEEQEEEDYEVMDGEASEGAEENDDHDSMYSSAD